MPDELVAAVQRESRRSGRSVSSLAREALSRHLHIVVDPDEERDLSFIGLGASNEPGVADQVDEILARDWTWDRLALGEDPDGDR